MVGKYKVVTLCGSTRFKDEFMKNPEKAIEGLAGIDIPDGMVDKVVDGVKAKIAGDKLSDAVGSLKKLF